MLAIRVQIVQWLDDSQLGFVESELVDTWNKKWSFRDKLPIFTAFNLSAKSHYPQPGLIDCTLVEIRHDEQGREIITIDTAQPWAVEATTGETQFEVLREQLADC